MKEIPSQHKLKVKFFGLAAGERQEGCLSAWHYILGIHFLAHSPTLS